MRFTFDSTMKIIFLVALIVGASGAIVPSPLFAEQQAASLRPVGFKSDVTCEFCEATVGQLVHEAVEAGWMGVALVKLCPALSQKYNIPEELCAAVAWLLMADAFNHVVPDSVYYCEVLHVCPKLPGGSATFTGISVEQKDTQSLVKVQVNVTVTSEPPHNAWPFTHAAPSPPFSFRLVSPFFGLLLHLIHSSNPDHTAAGEVELRLVATQQSGGLDVTMPKFNAGLPVGDHILNWEFSATSGLFSCDMQKGGCPGTYGIKISVCELECELDTAKKHEGNAVLDQDSSHTFQVP